MSIPPLSNAGAPPGPPGATTPSASPPVQDPPLAPPVRIFPAELIEERVAVVDERSWPFRVASAFGSMCEWLFGFACLLVTLAAFASVPLLQFASLGYLLEVSGRVSRSGRLRSGFFEIRKAARAGSIVVGTWLSLLPLRLISDLSYSAELIAPGSATARGWQSGLAVASVVVLVHILLAWLCGGRLRHFLWPLLAPVYFVFWLLRKGVSRTAAMPSLKRLLQAMSPRLQRDLTTVPALHDWFPPAMLWHRLRRGGLFAESRDAIWKFLVELRIPHYFWQGVQGFAGAVAWLFVPIVMIIATTRLSLDNPQASQGLGVLIGLIGSFLLAVVVLYLPFLQARFAAEQRFVAMFEIGQVRELFRRAPLAFWFALLVTLLFALPLYLLKVAVVPREVIWAPSMVFVAFIFPARLLTGWAVGRALHHKRRRHVIFRWLARLAAWPVVLVYVLIVYFTQYTSWYGAWSLLEQHAFLTPVPFLGL